MTVERNTTACFSGHRYYSGAEADEARLAAAVEAAWRAGYRTFISGMAPGFDLAAAEAVERLRAALCAGEGADSRERNEIKLIAAVPFAGQAAGWSADDGVRYERLIEAADEVRILEHGYSHGCYYRRDEWMVERSGRLICWFDGKKNGGTRYTVRCAMKHGLEIVNVFRAPDTLF
ncbi:MAG: SLOG family protein [Alistipes sp.]|nr:SLOG family protein [Alistipes sp.]